MKIKLFTIILLILTFSCGNAETKLDEDNICDLSNGERVEDGWSGNDKGNNFCNSCWNHAAMLHGFLHSSVGL